MCTIYPTSKISFVKYGSFLPLTVIVEKSLRPCVFRPFSTRKRLTTEYSLNNAESRYGNYTASSNYTFVEPHQLDICCKTSDFISIAANKMAKMQYLHLLTFYEL